MKKVAKYFLILALSILALTACLDMGGQDSEKTPKVTATPAVTNEAKEATQIVTEAPDVTVTPEVTEAPEVTTVPVVTETLTPTETPTPEVTETPTPKATEAPTATPTAKPENTGKKYRFRNYKLLDQHYEKHGIEMGFANREDYEKAASDVINNPKALHKTESEDGDYVYYVEETNEFVVLSRDGYIRTYFLPSQGKKYYDRQ